MKLPVILKLYANYALFFLQFFFKIQFTHDRANIVHEMNGGNYATKGQTWSASGDYIVEGVKSLYKIGRFYFVGP